MLRANVTLPEETFELKFKEVKRIDSFTNEIDFMFSRSCVQTIEND